VGPNRHDSDHGQEARQGDLNFSDSLLQILSAGSGIQYPLRHYDTPYGLYPYPGLPAVA